MKKTYLSPDVEIVRFDSIYCDDVIFVSGFDFDPDDPIDDGN